MRRWATAVALMLVMAACAAGGASDDAPIRIGASLPLSGERSEPGKVTRQGYEIWEELVNQAGGLLGRRVELVIQDLCHSVHLRAGR